MTLAAFEPIAVVDHFHGCLAEWADKNLQQLWINRHGRNGSTGTPPSIYLGGGGPWPEGYKKKWVIVNG